VNMVISIGTDTSLVAGRGGNIVDAVDGKKAHAHDEFRHTP